MPRDLPGMYWDEEKKRYFPLSSKPARGPTATAVSAQQTVQTARIPPQQSRKRKAGSLVSEPPIFHERSTPSASAEGVHFWRNLNALREGPLNDQRRRCMHNMQIAHMFSHSNRPTPPDRGIDIGESVSALCSRTDDPDDSGMFIGGGTGWLYIMDGEDPDRRWREFCLRSQITSITRSESITLVTSLGSPVSALVTTRAQRIGSWLLREFPPNICSDAWSGHIYDRTIVVGGKRGAVCFRDAEHDNYVRLHCESDVFSTRLQNENLLYLGMRNGTIGRWDLRQPQAASDTIVRMSEKRERTGGTPVQHLRIVNHDGLLVETMRGDLEIHDLRFLRSATPSLEFKGHVSSYQHRLGLAIDPAESFLFMGGGDSRLRAWSFRTGHSLVNDVAEGDKGSQSEPGPFDVIYPHPITALDIIAKRKTHLWAASQTNLHRVELGPNGILR
ncbi:hypothetical protein C2E23DRAFT_732503 [Lenzites betulinus]|nr:hypothetical protein C2E23DRAFT_732503 [Lenzites betulinus]